MNAAPITAPALPLTAEPPAVPFARAAFKPDARWEVPAPPSLADREVAHQCGVTPVFAAILRGRGHASASQVRAFLGEDGGGRRDPALLPGMAQAVARLHRAIISGEKILICGDYDVDGLTSTTLLWRALRDLKANVSARVPERCDGYDLKVPDVERAAAQGFTLILTADNGIRALQAVERARELGVDVVITDHHEPGQTSDKRDELPQAIAVVNPKRADSAYGFRELCGCGVAFKLIEALLREHWPSYLPAFEQKFIELVAIATVADCVPLEDENRLMVRDGLTRLASTKKRGLQALFGAASLNPAVGLRASDIGFRLGPRINSAGRFSQAALALQLLMSTEEAECRAIAHEIESLNARRQRMTQEITEAAIAIVEATVDLHRERALVIAGGAWGHGMVGLVASRLSETYARPAIVLGEEPDHWRGSGRSIPQFDLGGVIAASRGILRSGGGHAAACGLSFDKAHLEAFRGVVREVADAQLAGVDLVPIVEADCLVSGEDLTPRFLDELALLEPCGTGNRPARLMLRNSRVLNAAALGKDKTHLKWRLRADSSHGAPFEALWWKNADKVARWGSGSLLDVMFVPEWNEYNGQRRMQLHVHAARDAA